METLLNNIIKKIINILDKNNQYTELEHSQIYFGLQTIIYNLVVTSLILFLAYIMDSFIETLLSFTFFGALRIIAGGYHFDGIAKCIAATTFIMIGGGKFIQNIHISLSACILVCIFLNIIFFSYTPKGTKKNPYSHVYSIKQQKRLRVLSIFLTIIAIMSGSLLRPSIVFSMVIVAILLFPTWNHKSLIIE